MTADGAPTPGEFPATALFLGVGASSDLAPAELSDLIVVALAECSLDPCHVAAVATIDTRLDHPAVLSLGWPVTSYSAAELAAVATPNPSPAVEAAAGTPSVAEAAALLAAGPGAELIVTKRSSAHATVAIARTPLSSDRTHLEHS